MENENTEIFVIYLKVVEYTESNTEERVRDFVLNT